jgi:hypothetical protein
MFYLLYGKLIALGLQACGYEKNMSLISNYLRVSELKCKWEIRANMASSLLGSKVS